RKTFHSIDSKASLEWILTPRTLPWRWAKAFHSRSPYILATKVLSFMFTCFTKLILVYSNYSLTCYVSYCVLSRYVVVILFHFLCELHSRLWGLLDHV